MEAVDFKAQQLGAERMERAQPDAVRLGADEVGHAFLHFLGGLIGKGNGQDAVRCDAQFQEVSNAAGQDLGLARTGASRNQQRPFGMLDGFTLAVVEGIKNRIHALFPFYR